MRSVVSITGLLALVCMSFSPLQTGTPFSFIAGIKTSAKIIHTDNLGNLYIVTQTNQLYKFNRNGKPVSTLNYSYTGNIAQIDASNPMEVFVFYRELNKVVFLDNNLAFRGELDLSKAGIIQASGIARAYDNNVWVFDMGDLQLKKVSKKGEIEQMSGNIRQYTSGNTAVSHLYDNSDRVFVVDSINGIMMFDVFAAYIKTFPVKSHAEVKVLERYFFYYAGGRLNKYNWQTTQLSTFSLPDTSRLHRLSIEKERIYLHKPDSILIYGY